MNSKEQILRAIRSKLPPAAPLPDLPSFSAPHDDLFAHFNQTLHSVGGSAIELQAGESLSACIAAHYPQARVIASGLAEGLPGALDLHAITDPHDLRNVDLALLRGELAVAENAAIWLGEAAMIHRALPFITQHLVLVLRRETLVWNLHQAYERIRIDRPGFGLFISGPSKTADIEQSLVIGAHGARSLGVVWEQ